MAKAILNTDITYQRRTNAANYKYSIIFSDIHGNVDCLNEFRECLRGFRYQSAYCLGDITHKGKEFDENKTVELIKELNARCVRGNHDEYTPSENQTRITQPNLEFLVNLPIHFVDEDKLFFHSSLKVPHKRLKSEEAIREEAEYVSNMYPHVKFVFFGHTHQPAVYSYDKITGNIGLVNHSKEINFNEQSGNDDKQLGNERRTYFINPGELGGFYGQPHTIGVFDNDAKTLRIYTLSKLIEMSKKRYILLAFEEEWMPHLIGDDSRFNWQSMEEEKELVKQFNTMNEFNRIIELLAQFKPQTSQPTNKKKRNNSLRKEDYNKFTFQLAKELEKLATPEVLAYYDVRSPLETRDYYLSTRTTKIMGVECVSPLRVIK